MRKDRQGALHGSLIITLRRLTMLYMAMFVQRQQVFQMQVFMQLNFIALTYSVVLRPFEKAELNLLSIFNESIGLLASYFILTIQDYAYDPEQHYEIGYYIVYIF